MRYFVTIGDQTWEIEVGSEQTLVNGKPVKAELRTVPGTPTRHLLVDAASHVVLAAGGETGGEWQVQLNGDRVVAEVMAERTRAIRAMAGRGAVASGPKPVRAPMPGLVVRLEVEVGESVRTGQAVAIIEAMKMENELKADAAGRVTRIHVGAGQAVEKGQVLVEFEAES
jgi:biotin carboxyl carrier protein